MGNDTQSTADELRRVKAHIANEDDWFQGDYFPGCGERSMMVPDDVPCCIFGAVAHVRGEPTDTGKPSVVSALLVAHGAKYQSDLSDFNDDPDTTHSDIMALFDRAIAAAEATQ